MTILLLSIVALATAASAPVPAPTAQRSAGGASVSARVSVHIIAQSARIGSAYAAPLATMKARPMTIAAADGSAAPALIYDFE